MQKVKQDSGGAVKMRPGIRYGSLDRMIPARFGTKSDTRDPRSTYYKLTAQGETTLKAESERLSAVAARARRQLRTAIDVSEVILPLAVIDIAERARANPDAVVALSDITANGRLPDGVFVALHTGWGSNWPDKARMSNRDKAGIAHFPGWSAEVLAFLAKERQVTAIGHDTTDTDPGVVVSRREAPLEDYWLRQNKWQIELLANLDQVPSAGALIVASWPKPRRGSGFPARAFAIAPRERIKR